MAEISDAQVDKLLDDIASIKSVLTENKPLLKQLILPIHFRIVSLTAGLAIIAISALYYFLLEQYGSYSQIPELIRYVCLGILLVLYAGLGVLKQIMWFKSLKRINPNFTYGDLIKRTFTYQLAHIWLSTLAVMIFLGVYAYLMNLERFIVSIFGIGVGILYNSIGSITRIWQFLLTGYWLILTGTLPILLPEVSALILLAVCFGGGMLLFFLISGSSQLAGNEGA